MNVESLTYALQILDTISEGSEVKMQGKINTRLKCPVCKGKFQMVSEREGLMCPEHKTTPMRYYISADAFKCGLLYSDPKGRVFDSYDRTRRQLEIMRAVYNDKNVRFHPNDWIPSKVAEKRFINLSKQWLKGYEEEAKAEAKAIGTVQKLEQDMRVHLIPEFGDKDIRDIAFEDIEVFYHKLLKKGYAKKYIKNILSTLKSFLNRYRRNDAPEIPKFTVVPKKEKQWLGIGRQILLNEKIPEKYKLAIELLQHTGMRPGELRALTKNDLVDGCIYVYKTMSGDRIRNCRKSGGTVTYRINLQLWQRLVEYTQDMDVNDRLFSFEAGRLYKVWKKACLDAGVKYITIYQASRHSQASQIRQRHEEEALKEAGQMLGHSNLQTTKIYSLNNKNLHDTCMGENDE
jgi:integrase/uncharacterized protein YbaR (Trm112 family)